MSKRIESIVKLGTTRAGERTRVWLEGKRLADHGFACGVMFAKRWKDGALVLSIDPSDAALEARATRGTVSGSEARPVIDITGQLVADTFKTARVCAHFTAGKITITEHKE